MSSDDSDDLPTTLDLTIGDTCSVLSAWLCVRRGKIPASIVETDAEVPWEIFDESVRTYLDSCWRDGVPVVKIPRRSDEGIVLRALQLEALVEEERCSAEDAAQAFAAATLHPEEFFRQIVAASLLETVEMSVESYPDLMGETVIEAKEFSCHLHGETVWRQTICCEECGAPWQIEDETAPRFAPDICSCGTKLLPPSFEEAGEDDTYSASACCSRCFEDKIAVSVAHRQGMIAES